MRIVALILSHFSFPRLRLGVQTRKPASLNELVTYMGILRLGGRVHHILTSYQCFY